MFDRSFHSSWFKFFTFNSENSPLSFNMDGCCGLKENLVFPFFGWLHNLGILLVFFFLFLGRLNYQGCTLIGTTDTSNPNKEPEENQFIEIYQDLFAFH